MNNFILSFFFDFFDILHFSFFFFQFYLNLFLFFLVLFFNFLRGFFLFFLVFFPLILILILSFIKRSNLFFIKNFSFLGSVFIFFLSIILWVFFENFSFSFQYSIFFNWFFFNNINYSLGIDGISLLFIVLTTFLIPFCILVSWNSVIFRLKEFLICLFFIEFFLLNIFCALDIFLFYLYFESILIPMFLLIGVWGSRHRKVHAAYQFFLYTFLGSVLMLLGIFIIYFKIGTTDLQVFLNSVFSENRQLVLWLAFFVSFGVKVPMLPAHIWLPEAHVEAPTAGSVLLAGVLLKLGTYGVIRFLIPVFPFANFFFTPLIFTLSLIGVIYSSCTTIRQIDLKKIIAYSSVAHMNFALIGLFCPNVQSLSGSIFLMLSHGIVSSALFLCVGILYDRYHTRLLKYYGGLAQYMPFFTFFFLIFTLANIGFPGSINFLGEFLIIIGLFKYNIFVSFFMTFSVILGACYAIWLFNRLFFFYYKC